MIPPRDVYLDDVLRERWDYPARTFTAWDENGVQTESRPFTAEENAMADTYEDALIVSEAKRVKGIEREAMLEAIAVTATPNPGGGGAWTQPTGAHDAYAKDAEVTHGGKTWVSLTPFNAHEPGVSGWREVVAEGYPAWVQPAGAHDAYRLGDRVSHNGQDWENTGSDANVWEPGVFGWVVIP